MRPRAPLQKISAANALWALLAVIGLVLALVGARREQSVDVAGETLVWVNGRPITSAQLARAQQRLAAGYTRQLTEAEHDSLVRLLIDEELLLQRAESLGVVQADPGVRKAIVRASIDGIVEEFLTEPPEAIELEHFYQQHKAVFERPPRVAVEALRFVDLKAAQQTVDSAGQRGGWADLAASSDAHPVHRLPGSPLPAHMLRRYLGPAPAALALSLVPGEISPPVQGAGGAYLLRVTSIIQTQLSEYEDIAPIVRQEYLSRGRELALATKLASLWGEAEVQLNPRVSAGDGYVGMVNK